MSFNPQASADLFITGCSLEPNQVSVGETMEFGGSINNDGSVEHTADVEWVALASGERLASDSVTIPAGETAFPEAEFTPSQPIDSEIEMRVTQTG